MERVKELVNKIMSSSCAEAKVLAELKKAIFADGKVTEKEAQFVREMNYEVLRRCKDEETIKIWTEIFVETITAFVLEDEASKGVVDDNEAAWLANLIRTDALIVGVEKTLLKNLKAKSSVFPKVLDALI